MRREYQNDPASLSRRGLLGAGLASGLAAFAAPTTAAAKDKTDTAVTAYDEMIVVNTLGALHDPNDPHSSGSTGVMASLVSPRMIADALASGTTAINMTMGYVFGAAEPFESTVSSIAYWDAVIRRHPDQLMKVFTASDILQCKRERKLGIIFGLQAAEMFGDSADRVDLFANLGVRIMQLTYNGPNKLGGGALAPGNPPLTDFGRQLIDRMHSNRVVVDLSHSGERTCRDAIAYSKLPVAITHTACRGVTNLPRNKSDAELRGVAEKGGYIGIYFMPFLAINRPVTGDDVVAHLEYAINLCGEDHVGIGTDGSFTPVDDLEAYQATFQKIIDDRRARGISAPGERADVFPFAVDMNGPNQFRDLAKRLADRGHAQSRIEKILGGNFLRFAKERWGA